MEKENYINIEVSDWTIMSAYIARPKGESLFPWIILFQEAFWVNWHIRNVADRLAHNWYIVIAPELFHRTAPWIEIAYTDFSSAMPHMKALTNEGLINDIKAAYQWITNLSDVNKLRIWSIWFCLWGKVSFLANSCLDLSACISFYGGWTDEILDLTPQLKAPHLFFWGWKDSHITKEKRHQVITFMEQYSKPYINVEISYADHGFFCDERASYHSEAAKEAWSMSLSFLENKLK